jgi:hypothetical protein
MALTFHHDNVHTSTTMGITITLPPNSLFVNTGAHVARPYGTEAHRTRHGHSTQHEQPKRPKDQHLLHLYATGELFPSDKEEGDHAQGHLFIFLFYFHLFTMNVSRALPLEAIKGEAGATSRAMTHKCKNIEIKSTRANHNQAIIHPRTTPHKRPRIRSLSRRLVTPTASTSVHSNTSSSKTHWT